MNTSNQQKLVQTRRLRRQRRVRNRMSGTLERPRLAVFRSSKHIYAQMVNDQTGTTLVSASTLDPEVRRSSSTAATKPPRPLSAVWSPSEPKRPVLTRFASTVEATSTMDAWRRWRMRPARRA